MIVLPSGSRVTVLYDELNSKEISEPGTTDALHSRSMELFNGTMKLKEPFPHTIPESK